MTMILKMYDVEKDGWDIIPNVDRIKTRVTQFEPEVSVDLDVMYLRTDREGYPDTFVAVKVFSGSSVKTYLVEHGNTYLMNDEGKTIEHF
jgi:hypothetical protein